MLENLCIPIKSDCMYFYNLFPINVTYKHEKFKTCNGKDFIPCKTNTKKVYRHNLIFPKLALRTTIKKADSGYFNSH